MRTRSFRPTGLKGASRLAGSLGILCAGCILEPEPKTRTIACTLSADTTYPDITPPYRDTLVVKDGRCE